MTKQSSECLEIDVKGIFSATFSEGTWRPRSLKAQAVVSYLVLSSAKSETRERIAGLLWSESDEGAARVSLRQVISGLRKEARHLPNGFVGADRNNVFLAVTNLQLNVDAIDQALMSGVVPDELVDRREYFDDLLVNLGDVDPAFSLWLKIERQSRHDRALRQLLAIAQSTICRETKFRAAQAIRNLDPTNEEACRTLMKVHDASGDTASALRAYAELWDKLDEDFDMEPSLETQNLVTRIKLNESETPDQSVADTSRPAVADEPVRILFHPFDDIGLDARNHVLAMGFRHELITALTRFKDWSVRDYDPNVEEVSFEKTEKLFELIPAVIPESEVLNIIITLRRKNDGHYVWSESAALEIGKWSIVKKQFIRQMAVALDVQISGDRLARIATFDELDRDVYDLWLIGNNMLFAWNPDKEREAENVFRKILERKEHFAPAKAALAQILNTRHILEPGVLRDRDREAEALLLASDAVADAPMDNRTQLTLAWSYLLNDRFEQAELCYDLAFKLNEFDPWTLCSVAQGYSYCGQHERARKLANIALDVGFGVEPIHWVYLALIRFLGGDNQGAVHAIDRSGKPTIFSEAIAAAAYADIGDVVLANKAATNLHSRARKSWCGAGASGPRELFDWCNQLFPIRHEDDRQHLREALAASGLLEIKQA